MAYQQFGGGFTRQMVQGNWTCSGCGAQITELPFEPDPSRLDQLLCRDCHRARRGDRGGAPRQSRGGSFQRQMYPGNWTCSSCNAQITELPFEPRPDQLDTLLCRTCHREQRGSHSGGR